MKHIMKIETHNLKLETQRPIRKIFGGFSFPRVSSFKFQVSNQRGFTLVETLVAISVLMVAVASPLTIAQRSLSSAIYAKDQTTAFFLAQDAVEYLKYIRIEKSGQNWTDPDITPELSDCISSDADNPDKWCRVDTRKELSENAITQCPVASADCDKLKMFAGNRLYNHDAESADNPASIYSRRFTLIPISGPEAVHLKVNIRWVFGALGARDITINTLLYNWR